MKNTKGIAVAMDNCAALEVAGNRYRAISAKPKAGVYKVYWAKGKYLQVPLSKSHWRPLSELSIPKGEV
jgi:hypothetical protein